MSTLNSIILLDAASANVTFTRESGNGNSVTLRDASQGIFARAARLVLRAVLPSVRGKVVREQQEISIPIYDAEGVKIREYRFSGEFLIPTEGTEAERDLLLAYVKSLYATATMAENASDLNFSA